MGGAGLGGLGQATGTGSAEPGAWKKKFSSQIQIQAAQKIMNVELQRSINWMAMNWWISGDDARGDQNLVQIIRSLTTVVLVLIC